MEVSLWAPLTGRRKEGRKACFRCYLATLWQGGSMVGASSGKTESAVVSHSRDITWGVTGGFMTQSG